MFREPVRTENVLAKTKSLKGSDKKFPRIEAILTFTICK